MTPRKGTVSLPPCDPTGGDRGTPHHLRMIASRDWTEGLAGAFPYRHPETKRNEMFLMNVTPKEFAHLSTIKMQDFKHVRLGEAPFNWDGQPSDPSKGYRPMFGALKRGARLRRKERKQMKHDTD
jgi:hypothetical protein